MMLRRLRAALALVLAVAVAALAAGCFEEEVRVTLGADGRGKLTVEHTMGKMASAAALSFGGIMGGGDEELAQKQAASYLARWEGVAAWTDLEAKLTEDKKITFQATGWFEDLAAVRRVNEETVELAFAVSREGETTTVAVDLEQGSDQGPAPEELLDEEVANLKMQAAMLPGMLEMLAADYRAELHLELPAAAADAEGFTRTEGQTASLVRDTDGLGATINAHIEAALAIRKRVDDGELTREDALVELAALRAESASVRFAGGGALEGFDAQLVAAKETWDGSAWRRLVAKAAEDAKALGEMAEPEPLEEPPPEGLDRTTPDAFEPNQAGGQAKAITVGRHENLLLDEDDWYAIDVPADGELRVAIEFDENLGMLHVELHEMKRGDLQIDTEGYASHRRSLRFAPGEAMRVLIHVGAYDGEPHPYHLSVELGAFEKADVAEPNDTAAQAATLEVGAELPKLVSEGDDYYRVDVPKGQIVKIDLKVEGESMSSPGVMVFDEEVMRSLGSEGFGDDAGGILVRGEGKPIMIHVSEAWREDGKPPITYSLAVREAELQLAPDAFEPNQKRRQAKKITAGVHENLTVDPEDWFWIEVPDGQQLKLQAVADHEGHDGPLEVKVFEGGTRGFSPMASGDGSEVTLVAGTGKAAKLIIQVKARELRPYRLNLTLEAWKPADRFEPNDDRGSAAKLEAGAWKDLVLAGDDWYSVIVPKGKRLRVEVTPSDPPGSGSYIQLELTDELGSAIAESELDTSRVVEHAAAGADETVWVHVHEMSGKRAGYSMKVTLE